MRDPKRCVCGGRLVFVCPANGPSYYRHDGVMSMRLKVAYGKHEAKPHR